MSSWCSSGWPPHRPRARGAPCRLNSAVRLAERGALVQPQQVAGGEHRADGGDHHQRAVQRLSLEARAGRAVRAEDRRELAPEPGQAGQAERGHRAEPEDPAEPRHLLEHAAAAGDLERVVAVLHRAGEEEQHAGDQAVGDHAEHRGVDARAASAWRCRASRSPCGPPTRTRSAASCRSGRGSRARRR